MSQTVVNVSWLSPVSVFLSLLSICQSFLFIRFFYGLSCFPSFFTLVSVYFVLGSLAIRYSNYSNNPFSK